jgi:hypothetical protein
MESKHVIHQFVIGLIMAAFLTATLNACQSMGTASIAPDRRIALQPAGTHKGEADTGDLVVAYTYRLLTEPEPQIQISGGIRSARYRGNKTSVYLYFVDDTGKVLERKILYSSGYKRDVYVRRPSTFDTTMPLPPETEAIAFSSYVQFSSGRK